LTAGFALGDLDGDVVGVPGSTIGDTLGNPVGCAVDSSLLGVRDSFTEGFALGDRDGDVVGVPGCTIGDTLGNPVGCAVDSSLLGVRDSPTDGLSFENKGELDGKFDRNSGAFKVGFALGKINGGDVGSGTLATVIEGLTDVGRFIKLSLSEGSSDGAAEVSEDSEGAPFGDREDCNISEIVGGVSVGAKLAAVGFSDGSAIMYGLSQGVELSEGAFNGSVFADGARDGKLSIKSMSVAFSASLLYTAANAICTKPGNAVSLSLRSAINSSKNTSVPSSN
jgi:hypothetical protein